MWLTLQIAAGIVLAYVIIKNGASVWRWSLAAISVLAIAVAVFFLAYSANEAAAEQGGLIGILRTLLGIIAMLIFGITLLAAMTASGWSLMKIFGRMLKRDFSGEKRVFFLGMGNFFFTMLALQGFDMTDSGPIFRATNAFGRAHGLADGVTVALAGLASLWPVLVWYLFVRKAKGIDADISGGEIDD